MSRAQRDFLKRRDRLAHVELHEFFRLARCAVEGHRLVARPRRQQLRVVHVVRNLLRQPRDEDVAKLVGARQRVDVEDGRRGEPPGRDVVGEDGHRVLLPLVFDEMERLGKVAHHDA